MNKQIKEELYSKIVRTLTDYENETGKEKPDEKELYELLVEIQNSWEYLFSEDPADNELSEEVITRVRAFLTEDGYKAKTSGYDLIPKAVSLIINDPRLEKKFNSGVYEALSEISGLDKRSVINNITNYIKTKDPKATPRDFILKLANRVKSDNSNIK